MRLARQPKLTDSGERRFGRQSCWTFTFSDKFVAVPFWIFLIVLAPFDERTRLSSSSWISRPMMYRGRRLRVSRPHVMSLRPKRRGDTGGGLRSGASPIESTIFSRSSLRRRPEPHARFQCSRWAGTAGGNSASIPISTCSPCSTDRSARPKSNSFEGFCNRCGIFGSLSGITSAR